MPSGSYSHKFDCNVDVDVDRLLCCIRKAQMSRDLACSMALQATSHTDRATQSGNGSRVESLLIGTVYGIHVLYIEILLG